jgi:uncharacterized OB-fold protein
MTVTADYLGLTLQIADLDHENLAFFKSCAEGKLRLQRCCSCHLLRYPPTTACPFCAEPAAEWSEVEAHGVVHSYTRVHHAIQPGLKPHTPYVILLVELDTQRRQPGPGDGLRVVGNLADETGRLAPPDMTAKVGIGSRVRMVFARLNDDLAIPHWTLDGDSKPWRYPGRS